MEAAMPGKMRTKKRSKKSRVTDDETNGSNTIQMTKHASSWKQMNPRESVWNLLYQKIVKITSVNKGSISHWNLVHKFIPVRQAKKKSGCHSSGGQRLGEARKVANEEVAKVKSHEEGPWSYDMESHAKKCVERYCELANKTTQQLYKVSTPCIDDHHFTEEETKAVGELPKVCSHIVLTCLCLARIGRPDILWSVDKLARSITKCTKACGKRLSRLISYIHHKCEYIQYCRLETLPNNADWDCFKTLTSREILKIPNPLLEEHCEFSEGTRSCP